MTTLSTWIDASVDTITNCAGCLAEVKANPAHVLIQLYAMKRHIDSMILYLERQGK